MSKENKPGLLTMAWFRPLYRRLIVVGIIVAWCGWEWLYNRDQFWGFLTVAMLAYAVWTFFINFEKELAKHDDAKPKD